MSGRLGVEAARFLRFALVGGTGFLIDAGLLTVLHDFAGVDPFTARLVSITASAFTTWRLNRSLTFGASERGQAAEGVLYALVAAITAVLNYLVYVLILIAWRELPPLAAAIAATLAAMLFSYAGYSRVVFAGAATVVGPPSSQRR
jgi:putative flippase GtrA